MHYKNKLRLLQLNFGNPQNFSFFSYLLLYLTEAALTGKEKLIVLEPKKEDIATTLKSSLRHPLLADVPY